MLFTELPNKVQISPVTVKQSLQESLYFQIKFTEIKEGPNND